MHIKKLAPIITTVFLCTAFTLTARTTPRLTVIIVVDQLSPHKLASLKPYFKRGLHNLLHYGTVYHNAQYPYGTPTTCPGHTTLATGTYPQTHGIVGNAWYNKNNTIERADETYVDATKANEKSPLNIKVDTLTDTFVMASPAGGHHRSYSISLKDSPAILTAGRLGKPLWLDEQTGLFTSSSGYFNALPAWVERFNTTQQTDMLTEVTWQRAFPKLTHPYHMFNEHELQKSLLDKKINIDASAKKPFSQFMYTPTALTLLFNLARACVDTHVSKNQADRMLLWICVSCNDLIGHEFGPDSVEATDLLYHLDRELYRFYNHITKHIRKKDVLCMLTSDHGGGCVPEQMHQKGYTTARRIMIPELHTQLNKIAYDSCKVQNMINGIIPPYVYLNTQKVASLSPEKQKLLLHNCKTYIQNTDGICNVWTYDELHNNFFAENSFATYFKRQLHRGRSGQLIIQPNPYCFLSSYSSGTTHESPYNYDTHVPLILYQCRSIERAQIYDKVTALQCAPTLAYILGIPKPSACTASLLPGIAPANDPCF